MLGYVSLNFRECGERRVEGRFRGGKIGERRTGERVVGGHQVVNL